MKNYGLGLSVQEDRFKNTTIFYNGIKQGIVSLKKGQFFAIKAYDGREENCAFVNKYAAINWVLMGEPC
ncbi:MAG: hypothetical protein HRU20_23970 [Pseudomonadales bacterium]|nr:hypothetical protein [Pseudomonadales bacterium]